MPLSVIKRLVKVELMEACKTTNVVIKAIEFDDELYGYDEDPDLQELNQMLTVIADISTDDERFADCNGVHPWMMEWSCDMAQFITVMRDDQEPRENDKEMS